MARFRQLASQFTVRLALAVAVLVGGIAGVVTFVPQLHHAPAAHAASLSDDILMIHGFAGGNSNGSDMTVPTGCNGGTNWGPALTLFKQQGWTGSLKTVGFYGEDGRTPAHGCDVTFAKSCYNLGSCYDGQGFLQMQVEQHQSRCDTYNYVPSDDGTNNQDLGNIACQLAWYIWNNYTSVGRSVRVMAHSMGGLIIRYALDAVQNQDPAFPPYLYVPTVVTFATPHGGIVSGATYFTCGGCHMFDNMENSGQYVAGAADYFIHQLEAEPSAPIGSNLVPTEWTVMGDKCESFYVIGNDQGVPDSSALNFPSSASGLPPTHKYDYSNVPGQPGCNSSSGTVTLSNYDHGNYLTDPSVSNDAAGYYCDNCSQVPTQFFSTMYHALYNAWLVTGQNAPAPAMNCSGTPNEANCNGFTYREQNCPDVPQSQTASDANISVVLQYSGNGSCQTNWTVAQITSAGQAAQTSIEKVDIERQATSRLGAATITDTLPDYNYINSPINNHYSRMLWAPTAPTRSCAWYDTRGTIAITGPICTPWSPVVTTCASQPNTTNCDNQDYQQQGCNSYPQSETYSDANVQMTLYYSTNCQSNWTLATIKNSGDIIRQIDIERQSTPLTPASTLTEYPDTTSWYTNMLWAPVAAARGCVWYGPVNSHNTLYGPFCTPWSPTVTNCKTSPSDANCDGQDYLVQGCNAYAQSGGYSSSVLSVTLYYSTNCQSNWTLATIKNSGYFLLKVDIERAGNSSYPAKTITEYPTSSPWHTSMIWAPYNSARGCAWYSPDGINKIYGPYCTNWV